MKQDIHYLTPEGLEDLQKQMKYLTEVRLIEVTQRLHASLQEGGDLYDNPEYIDAKREQDFVEDKIAHITDVLDHARTIKSKRNEHTVRLGSHVTVVEKGGKQEEVYILVDSAEANPREGKISDQSPMGHALMGAKVGDNVIVNAPDGKITFRIKTVE